MPASFAWRVDAPVWPVSVAGWLPIDEGRDRAQAAPAPLAAIFRLRPGLSLDNAHREVSAAAARHAAIGEANATYDASIVPLDDRRVLTSRNVPLFVLLGAVAMLVLVACVNVANLVVARSLSRQRELSLRAAIGASRGRLVRQAVTESLVLATLAGVFAILVALLSRGALVAFVPAELGLFRANPAAVDARTIGACAGLVLLATVFSALPSVLRTRRTDLGALLAGSERSTGSSPFKRPALAFLQSAQVALTVVLVAACMLLATSFVRLVHTDLGFDPAGLAKLAVDLPGDRYPTVAARDEFFARLLDELRRTPSIASATYANSPAFAGVVGYLSRPEELTSGAAEDPQRLIRIMLVAHDAFDVIGQRIVAGRPFSASDGATFAPVAIIDANSAERLYPGESPVGRQIRYRDNEPWLTIVGVVSPVKAARFARSGTRVDVYRPYAQQEFGQFWPRSLLVREREGDAARAIGAARAVVRRLDPALPALAGEPVIDEYASTYDSPRFHLTLMSLFAGLALTTAAVGLFGLLNFSVVRRRREIGVRIALGASQVRVRIMILRDALLPVVFDVATGLLVALWATEAMRWMLYETTPSDPLSYAAALGVLALTAAVAAWLPAQRATRVDPAVTLRSE
jgi:putative ABC transport system permease protein